ncbi:MAG: NPCBM/NEW2 domain-containing protein [Planctomycetales bacterium]
MTLPSSSRTRPLLLGCALLIACGWLHAFDKGGENVPSAPITGKGPDNGIQFKSGPGGTAAATNNPTKQPVPSVNEQRAARKVIEHAFRDDFAKANTTAGNLVLIRTLVEKGSLTEDDPIGRYVMLDIAKSRAIENGEVDLAFQAVEELSDSHNIPRLEAKRKLVRELLPQVRGSDSFERLAVHALGAMQEAIGSDDYLSAASFRQAADAASQKGRNPELKKLIAARSQDLKTLELEYGPVQLAKRTLQQNPNEPGACLKAGQYYALSLGEWDRGLPLLAKTNDNTFRRLASLELKNPTNPNELIEIADGWWNWGNQCNNELQQSHAWQHAVEWYNLALPNVKGLNEARITRRLQDYAVKPPRTTFALEELPGKVVYLSDLKEQEVRVIRNAFGKNGRNNTGEYLRIKDKHPAHGLYTPPPPKGTATVVYDVRKISLPFFRAAVGVHDAAGSRLKSPLVFEVWGDHTRLWKSNPITRAGQVEACKIPITTVSRLELKVICSGSDEFAWAVWSDPRLSSR